MRAVMRRLIVPLALAFVLASSLLAPGCRSWGNGGYSSDPQNPDYGTHDWVADRALALVTGDKAFLSTMYRASFLLGTEAPDNPQMIGDAENHHVYYDSMQLVVEDNSARRARDTFSIAKDLMSDGNLELAAYYAGAMTHYISDLGVFGHTMGSNTVWGAEQHHSDYEAEVGSRIFSLGPTPPATISPVDPYNVSLELARKITFGSGSIKPNTWMDVHYDWSDPTFVSSADASLFASVYAVASAIQYLVQGQSGTDQPLDDGSDDGPSPDDDASRSEGIPGTAGVLALVAGAVLTSAIAVVAYLRKKLGG